LAVKKVKDLGKLKLIGGIKGITLENNMYFPFVIESYNEESNYYTLVSYLSTNDYISLNKTMLLDGGILDINGNKNTSVSIPIDNFDIEMHAFFKNDDTNYAHNYSNIPYVSGYTLTNSYTQTNESSIAFIKSMDFIRGNMKYLDVSNSEYDYSILLKEVPLVKANWIKNYNNLEYFIAAIERNYKLVENAYELLENNFSIDMKFFNTYGKSRFYKVGIKDTSTTLNSVNCSFRFGISLSSISSFDIFRDKFKTYVKDYIESLNDVDNQGKSIYIMNMIADIKNNFPEISHIEYYGMNIYEHEAQKIESLNEEEIKEMSNGVSAYVPEFINIYSAYDGLSYSPKIDIYLLE